MFPIKTNTTRQITNSKETYKGAHKDNTEDEIQHFAETCPHETEQ